jgi:hypothetical protein
MAYKPPKQSIIDNDLKGVPSNEAVFEALKLKLPKPSIDGTNGQLLARGASADDTSWVNPPSAGVSSVSATAPLASSGGSTPTISITQGAGDLDKVLVSNGTAASFQYAGLGSGFGTGNVIVGRAKPTNLTGTYNLILSTTSGTSMTTGSNNVLAGYQAGLAQTTASDSILIGNSAGKAIVQGSSTIAIGNSSLFAANANGTGVTGAVAIGYQALQTLTTLETGFGSGGQSIVAIGYRVGQGVTAANGAVLIGHGAGSNATGANLSEAIFIGPSCGRNGNRSIGIGRDTLGSYTGTGLVEGAVVGHFSATALTTGVRNCMFGYQNGITLTTGSSNILLGHTADTLVNSTSGGIALGYASKVGSNDFAVGSATSVINNVLLGRGGAAQTSAHAVKIMTMQASGTTNTSMTAGTLTLAGSQGTGTGAGGAVFIATAPASTTGSTTNAHVNRLQASAAGDISVLTGQLTIDTAGKGLSIKEGSNAKMGVTTAFPTGNPNRFTVSTTAITANSRIFLTIQDYTGAHNPSVKVYSRDVGAGNFIIEAGDNSFTGTVAWMLVEPA